MVYDNSMIKELKKMQPPDYKMYGFFAQFYTVKERSVHYQNISIQTAVTVRAN